MKSLRSLILVGISIVLAACTDAKIEVSQPFSLELTSSTASLTTTGVLTLTATPSSETKTVEFFEGTAKLGEVKSSPYTLALNLNASNNGEHTYTAKATSSKDIVASSKPIKVTIAISNPNPDPKPTLTLSPTAATLTPGGAPTTFTATLSNSDKQISWSLEGLGSISTEQGLSTVYTPPASISKTETAKLTASVAGTSLTAVATITLSQTAPTTGTIEVSVNGLSSIDADIAVSGPDGFNQKVTKTITLNNLKPGSYTVTAKQVNAGTANYQPNKITQVLDLKAGQTLGASVTYVLVQTTGSLQITINGLASDKNADVTITGPNSFSQKLIKSITITNLKPGLYTVTSKAVSATGTDTYQPDKASQVIDLKAGQTLAATFTYALVKTTASLKIIIEGLPIGTDAEVAVFDSSGGFFPLITKATTLTLAPGKYKVVGQTITGEGYEYKASPEIQDIEVKAGDAKSVNVTYIFSQSILFVNSSSGIDTNQGLKVKPFKTITKALDKVVAGQTVLVQNGTYGASSGESFPLRVKSGVTLEGETFRGIAIIGNGVCLSLKNVSDIRVSKLGFQCDLGIFLQDSANILLEQVVIASSNIGVVVKNSVVVLDTVETYDNDEGLSVEGTSSVTFKNSKAFRNRTGISLLGSAQLTLANSSASENLDVGIAVYETSKLEINNSHIDSNGNISQPDNGGLLITQSSGGSVGIANSTINSNVNSGINLACSTPISNAGNFTMTNSQIMSNDAFGLCVGNATGIISLKQNLFGFNKLIQIYDDRPDNQSAPIFAPQTSIDDGAGIYDLSGIKTGPVQDTNIWKITGANNKICFEACL
jgi:parallel beta-helix repeat protein